MRLSDTGLANKDSWQGSGYELPAFDRELVRQATIKEPIWVHFGAGNIFRAFPAALQQQLLDAGQSQKASSFARDTIMRSSKGCISRTMIFLCLWC